MPNLMDGRIGAILLFLIVIEFLLGRFTGKHRYDVREALANLSMQVPHRFIRVSLQGATLLFLSALAEWSPFRWPFSAVTAVLTFLAVDFLYYWYHRAAHRTRFLWALHEVHHSSTRLNLTTAARLSWFVPGLFPLFFAPAVLLGFPAEMVVVAMGVNVGYQFFIHTPWVPRLGVMEGWLNTPSAHRVHHSCNARHRGRNLGGVLVVWDRFFGTYAIESGEMHYGTDGKFHGYNPLRLQWAPVASFCRKLRR